MSRNSIATDFVCLLILTILPYLAGILRNEHPVLGLVLLVINLGFVLLGLYLNEKGEK